MRYLKLGILIFFIGCLFIENVKTETNLAPLCVAQVNNFSFPCSFMNSESEEAESIDWKPDSISIILNQYNYTSTTRYINTSTAFYTDGNMELRVLIDNEIYAESVWMLNMTSITQNCYKFYSKVVLNNENSFQNNNMTYNINSQCFVQLHISFIPLSKFQKFTNIQIEKITTETDKETDVLNCDSQRKLDECEVLNNARFTFQPHSAENIIVLSMSARTNLNLNILLMQGNCDINCSGIENNCDVENNDYVWPMLDEESNGVFVFEHLETSFYYCLRVNPIENHCCVLGTHSVHLQEIVNMNENIFQESGWWRIKEIIIFGILILFFAVIAIAPVIFRKVVYLLNNFGSNCNEPAREAFIHVGKRQKPQVEVLLIYSRESEEFKNHMEQLAESLKQNYIHVWDPLSPMYEEEVSANPTVWLGYVMNRTNIKFVVVANKEGVARANAWLQRNETTMINPHHLDDVFILALSSIYNKPELVFNYLRLFIVSFEPNLHFTDIVPCRRYKFPQQYEQFLHDLQY